MAKKNLNVSEEKEVLELAEQLGLPAEVIAPTEEPVVAEEVLVEKPKVSRRKQQFENADANIQPTEEKQKVPKVTAPKSSVITNTALAFYGYPVNATMKPLEIVNGVEKEVKVPFNAQALEGYRGENGRVVIRVARGDFHRIGSDTLDIEIERKDGSKEKIITLHNRARSIKRAKTWASLLKLAFDPSRDIELLAQGGS